MSLQDIVNVNITATTTTPTAPGFGTGLIAAHHNRWSDRVRSYTGLPGMLADGFDSAHPVYRQAAAIFGQNPRPARVKVGRRNSAPAQVINLTPTSPTTGVVYSFNVDGVLCGYTALAGDNLAAACTGLAASFNALAGMAASSTAIVASGLATTTGVQNITSFNGSVGVGTMAPARALKLVLNAHANWLASTITVTGKNAGGQTITETFTVPSGGGVTLNGSKRFAQVTQITIPVQGGTSGTLTVGYQARATADGTSGTKVVITTTIAGELLAFDSWAGPIASAPSLALFDATADPGIVADLAAIALADSDWYGLLLDSNSKAEILAAAPWVEASGKIFVAQSADDACTDGSSTTDVMYLARASSYFRTAIEYTPNVQNNPIAAGMLGNRLPADPGSDTWAFKTLAGISSYSLTDTQANAVRAKNGGTYLVIAGVPVTQDGKVAAGEFADVIRFRDWLQANMQIDVFTVLTANPKLPFTDAGVELLKGVVLARMKKGAAAGGIDDSSPMLVTAPKVATVSPTDRANRHLPGLAFSCRLAGAIHSLDINGTVSV